MSASGEPSSNVTAPVPAESPAPTTAESPALAPANAPAPASELPPGGADEMIAQAASEQIEQLLAKADVERPAPDNEGAAPSPAAPADVSSRPIVAVDATAEKPVQESTAQAPLAEEQIAPAPVQASSTETSPVEARGNEASAKGKPQAATAGAPEAPTVQDAKSKSDAPVTNAPATEEPETDAVAEDEQHASEERSQAPAWLIPLELVNRPFESIPDSIRSALGKAAILTLINATALLVYVFKFRK